MRWLHRFSRLAFSLQIALIMVTAVVAFAAANNVTVSGAGIVTDNINPNDLAPAECAHINLTNIVTTHSRTYRWNGGTVYVYDGTNGNDLIIGSDRWDDLFGNGGNDCLLAGDGLDYIWAGDGDDVLNGGGDVDVCYGNAGNDTEISCNDAARKATKVSVDPDDPDADVPLDPEFSKQRP